MSDEISIRAVEPEDYDRWLPLWHGYNVFYGRSGEPPVPAEITAMTWGRFFDAYEPLHALIAEQNDQLLGLVHFLYHRHTNMIEPICYLEDLFTAETARGQGIGRALIEGVYARAKAAGASRVYWMTQETNATAMRLYDRVAERPGFVMYRKEL